MTIPRPLALRLLPLALACGLALAGCASPSPAAPAAPAAEDRAAPPADALAGFAADRRAEQLAYEAALRDTVDPERLRAWHDLLSSRPHVAGTPGDREVIEALAREMAAMGLEVEVQELDLYLPRPVRAELTVVAPQRVPLELQEAALAEDPWSGHPELQYGWNAYSGSGTVEAGVVYANYATREDFARLAELGVEVAGRIVVARYGRSFRGYKARFAEEAGAVGLVLYGDPEDAGYVRGRMWPDGGWANGTAIQRGSVLTLPYPGDPLTPFTAALAEGAGDGAGDGAVERLDPASVDFPGIPVQPVGWQAAAEILGRMTGPAVPEEWQGALPFNYRLAGGEALRLRLRVEQESELVRTANVVGTLPGERFPDEKVIVGCHHDAWSFGAGDPNAGSILVLEAARAFAAPARAGHRPDRSLVFAHWGAEEFGILGSVEWVEAHAGDLAANAVAYVNLDMAAMGPRFGASATPSLADLVVAASREVEQAGEPGVSVHDAWAAASDGEPRLGALGGGSDHVGFYGHLGVPSISLGGGGSPGVSYHTNYENLAWYRQVVGDDYEPARMLAEVVVTLTARLAEADLVPLAPAGYGEEAARRLAALAGQWEGRAAGEPAAVPAGVEAGALGPGPGGGRPAAQDGAAAAGRSAADVDSDEVAADSNVDASAADAGAAASHAGAVASDETVDAGSADPAALLRALAVRADEVAAAAVRARRRADAAVAAGTLAPAALADAHRALLAADRAWVDPDGLPGRPWYRNLFAAPDADSGYAAWVLPELVAAVEGGDRAALGLAARRIGAALDRLAAAAAALEASADPSAAAATAVEPTRGGER
jgi:N-acetylated-alpha-linked acidic dipeptidase